MKATVLRASGTTVALACSLLLPAGIASAQSISTTGADSTNTITDTNTSTCTIKNSNDVDVTNNNPQSASSGDVTTNENTSVGTVTSGDASNSSDTSLDVSLTNTGCAPQTVVPPVVTPTPTPTPVVMAPQVSAPVQGGMGGEVAAAPTSQQVVAPVGGVGAGSGGPGVLATVLSVTTASTLWLATRVRRQFAGLFS